MTGKRRMVAGWLRWLADRVAAGDCTSAELDRMVELLRDDIDPLLTYEEAAEYLKVDRQTLYLRISRWLTSYQKPRWVKLMPFSTVKRLKKR